MRGADRLPAGEEKRSKVRAMFDAIAPRYDFMNRLMTFGMDVGWRRRTVASLGLPPGSVVLDVACGTGDLCRELESAGCRAFGFDISAGMLAAAKTSVPLVLADALRLPVAAGAADGVTCGFALRNVVDLKALFEELARVLRSGGRVALLETAQPQNPISRGMHAVYFHRVVPLIGGLLSDRSAYSYLPRSSAYLPGTEALLAMLSGSGFSGVSRTAIALGAAQLITGTRA